MLRLALKESLPVVSASLTTQMRAMKMNGAMMTRAAVACQFRRATSTAHTRGIGGISVTVTSGCALTQSCIRLKRDHRYRLTNGATSPLGNCIWSKYAAAAGGQPTKQLYWIEHSDAGLAVRDVELAVNTTNAQ